MAREVWRIFDSRTDQSVGMASYPTRESAEQQIEEWRERDSRGGRPDVHDLMPYLHARLVARYDNQ